MNHGPNRRGAASSQDGGEPPRRAAGDLVYPTCPVCGRRISLPFDASITRPIAYVHPRRGGRDCRLLIVGGQAIAVPDRMSLEQAMEDVAA